MTQGNRKPPRPMPRPVRWMAALLAFTFVISLGVLASRMPKTDDDARTDVARTSAPTKKRKNVETDGYAGLKTAGIPTPGKWSRQSLLSIEGTQGSEATQSQVGGEGGPVDVALKTVDAILDPTPSDEEWNRTMQNLFRQDMAGMTHGPSNMARYWWKQRRFQPDRLCTGVAKDVLVIQSYDCSADHTFQGDATTAVKDTQYWYSGTTFFDVPQRIAEGIPSSTDPQSVISQYYDAVAIPMDDGVWHVTVACPATADHPVLDRNGDELADDGRNTPGRRWITAGSMVGVGTNQRPCQPVEITVGGQRPFWYIGADGSD